MAETVTVVGASVRAAAASAVRSGLRPVAGDLFADLDLQALASATRVANYPRGLARIIVGSQPGGWLYTGGLENYPALVDRLARSRPLWGNPASVLARVRQPQLVAESLRSAGLACPALCAVDGRLPLRGKWLVKTRRSSGGLHVHRYVPDCQPRLVDSCYLQQFIAGAPCGAVYLAAGRRSLLLGVSEQLVGAPWLHSPGFAYAGSIGPLGLSAGVREQFRRIGAVLAAEFQLVGLFGVDAIVRDEAVWPIEVNPRYTASVEVLEEGYGWAALGAHVETCRSGRLAPAAGMTDAASQPRQLFGKAVLFAPRALCIEADVSRRWLEASNASRSFFAGQAGRPRYADIPPPDTIIPQGGPILTLLASGSDVADVRRKLQHLATETERELAAFALPSDTDTTAANTGPG